MSHNWLQQPDRKLLNEGTEIGTNASINNACRKSGTERLLRAKVCERQLTHANLMLSALSTVACWYGLLCKRLKNKSSQAGPMGKPVQLQAMLAPNACRVTL